jgi:hypothetical protein
VTGPVLQADRTTHSALSFNVAIFGAVNSPSSSIVSTVGGVSINAGSGGPF